MSTVESIARPRRNGERRRAPTASISKESIKFNLTIPLQQLNGLETLVIIMVANKYAFLQITRRRFLNEWEAFKKVISRRNIRRRITIPLTLSNLKLLRRITRTETSFIEISRGGKLPYKTGSPAISV